MLKKLLISLATLAFIISPVLADQLGPASSSNVGSDPETLNTLQPANSAGIPSASATGGGIGLPSASSALQPAGTKSDLPTDLVVGSASNSPSNDLPSSPDNNLLRQLFVGVIGIFLLISAFFLYRISRIVEKTQTQNNTSPKTEENDDDTYFNPLFENPETLETDLLEQAPAVPSRTDQASPTKTSSPKKPRKSSAKKRSKKGK